MVVGPDNATVPLLRINPPPANYTVFRHQLNPLTILISRGANKQRCEPDNILLPLIGILERVNIKLLCWTESDVILLLKKMGSVRYHIKTQL